MEDPFLQWEWSRFVPLCLSYTTVGGETSPSKVKEPTGDEIPDKEGTWRARVVCSLGSS